MSQRPYTALGAQSRKGTLQSASYARGMLLRGLSSLAGTTHQGSTLHEIVLIHLKASEVLHISEVVLVFERRRWAKAIDVARTLTTIGSCLQIAATE
jgi:hypothetical protein